jgi:hypothetical protein
MNQIYNAGQQRQSKGLRGEEDKNVRARSRAALDTTTTTLLTRIRGLVSTPTGCRAALEGRREAHGYYYLDRPR